MTIDRAVGKPPGEALVELLLQSMLLNMQGLGRVVPSGLSWWLNALKHACTFQYALRFLVGTVGFKQQTQSLLDSLVFFVRKWKVQRCLF